MIEFLKLLRSLFMALLNYIYNTHIAGLRSHYSKLANHVVKNQRFFIIVPVSVAFVLGYPSIYSSWTGSWINDGCGYRTDLRYIDGFSDVHSSNQLEILQVWLGTNKLKARGYNGFDTIEPDALSREFLEKVWVFQSELLTGIPNDQVFVHSPLVLWDNDIEVFDKDEHILKTINRNKVQNSIPGQSITSTSLFGDVVKVNGLIKSAKLVRIAMLAPKGSPMSRTWSHNLEKYIEENENNKDFYITKRFEKDDHFLLRISKLNFFDHAILTLSYFLIGVYFMVSLINLNSVRSKFGLLLGFVVEIILSILSSATLTSYFYQGVAFDQIPLQFLPFVVIVVSIENMFRLVTSVSKTPKEISINQRLSKALTDCGLTSTLIILTDCLILCALFPYVSKDTQKFLVFVGFSLIIDHLLHLTYFASILSIDVHRLELCDLLDDESADKTWSNSILKSHDNSSSFGQNAEESTLNRLVAEIRRVYKQINLPLSTTVWGTIIVTLGLVIMNIRWSNDIFSPFNSSEGRLNSSFSEELLKEFKDFLNRDGFNEEILSLVRLPNDKISIDAVAPTVLFLGNQTSSSSTSSSLTNFNTHISYTFDIYYIFEFLTLLVFILSVAWIVMSYFTKDLTFKGNDKSTKFLEKEDSFQAKILSGGHYLDIIKTATSHSSFIASVGLDHRVLVWSPVSKPLPKPTQLPISSEIWPIVNIVISDSGNFITLFSKSGVVQCWSRLTMTWAWKFEIPELKGNRPLETFFRYKTIPAFLQRKRAAANKLGAADELLSRSRRNSLRSIASPQLNPTNTFSNAVGLNTDLSEDFIVVLSTGVLLTVSCKDMNNTISREKLHSSSLVTSSKLITPRVNDRLVSYTEEGKLLVSTAVNNKWKTRTVNVQNTFNHPNQIAPAGLINEPVRPTDSQLNTTQIAVVPFVGFMVKIDNCFAELIDVQTGISIKKVAINDEVKQNSLQVFHDQPTHCRFCGSVSIASFSIAYSLKNKTSMVMHSFKVDHKAKTSICLRVERDPREIRCVGFNQVSEHIYRVDNIEGWSANDQNEILGLRKKSEDEILESVQKYKRETVLRQRKTSTHGSADFNDSASRLHNLWEGWKLSAGGKLEILKIPDSDVSDGLLVNSVGEINKFGHKSIVVVVGNIMKILYLGNDELIYHDDKHKNNSLNTNEEINGLNFINRRRKLNKDKQQERYAHSTNFSEMDAIPGLSELAL